MNRLRTLVFTLILSASATLTSTSCSSDGSLLPARSALGGDAMDCEDREANVDTLISEGKWPFVLGYVESVEPVLDVVLHAGEDHLSSTRCEKLESARPAIRVKLRVEAASWDEHHEGDILTLGIGAAAWLGYDAVPVLDRNGRIEWSDGQQYFRKGTPLLAIGGLLPSGEFFTLAQNILRVTDEGTIRGYQPSHCIEGSLDGRDAQATIDQAHRAGRGETPVMRGDIELLMATICYD